MLSDADRKHEEALLLQLHAESRRAHFANDAELMLAHDADPIVCVREGEVLQLKRAELLAIVREDLQGAAYSAWDDLEPPIIHVAGDASSAWAIHRVSVRRTVRAADGNAQEQRFVYAGIDTYEKRDGTWVRIANASTFGEG